MLIVGYSRAAAPSNRVLPNVPDGIWHMAWDLADSGTVTLDASGHVQTLGDKVGGNHLTGNPTPPYTPGRYCTYGSAAGSEGELFRTGMTFDTTPRSLFVLCRPTGAAKNFIVGSFGTASGDFCGIVVPSTSSTFTGAGIAGNPDMYLGGTLVGQAGSASLNRQNVFNAVWSQVDRWIVLEVRGFVLNPASHTRFHLLEWESASGSTWEFYGDIAWAGLCSASDAAAHAAAIVGGLQARAP